MLSHHLNCRYFKKLPLVDIFIRSISGGRVDIGLSGFQNCLGRAYPLLPLSSGSVSISRPCSTIHQIEPIPLTGRVGGWRGAVKPVFNSRLVKRSMRIVG